MKTENNKDKTGIREDNRLRVFLTLAQNGSFTGTAETLGVTQPSISQNISELERLYGIKLFERERGAATLTEQGKLFLEYAERIEGAYRDLAVFASKARTESDRQEDGSRADTERFAAEKFAEEMLRGMLPTLRKMSPGLAQRVESCFALPENGGPYADDGGSH